jgi:hypothetical protein
MTLAERQARHRAAHATDTAVTVKMRYRKPADRRSRPQRWRDAVTELLELQADYQGWLDGLPESLADTPTADALRAVCDLDLSGLELDPPRGFGRD